jgi:hypothetical protein
MTDFMTIPYDKIEEAAFIGGLFVVPAARE